MGPHEEAVKEEPAPHLTDVNFVSGATVYDFMRRGSAAELLKNRGHDQRPDRRWVVGRLKGQPTPTMFQVALWRGDLPDPFSGLDAQVRLLASRAGGSRAGRT